MHSSMALGEKDWLACCGSTKFAQEMVLVGPFSYYEEALDAAKDIWFNKVDVHGWLEAFAAHPRWGVGEQSTAIATATDSTLEELYEWNDCYREKFGFVFLIFASGRSTPEIFAELKRRYNNRPIVEIQNAAREQMKIMKFRLSKLFSVDETADFTTKDPHATYMSKAGGFVLDALIPALVFYSCMFLMLLVFSLICYMDRGNWDDEEPKFFTCLLGH